MRSVVIEKVTGRQDDEIWRSLKRFTDGHAGFDAAGSRFVTGGYDDTPDFAVFDKIVSETVLGIVEKCRDECTAFSRVTSMSCLLFGSKIKGSPRPPTAMGLFFKPGFKSRSHEAKKASRSR